jgi:hypothetical protein
VVTGNAINNQQLKLRVVNFAGGMLGVDIDQFFAQVFDLGKVNRCIVYKRARFTISRD